MSRLEPGQLLRAVYDGALGKVASEGDRMTLAKVATHLACAADNVPAGQPIPPATLEKVSQLHAFLAEADRDGRARLHAELQEQEKLAANGDAKATQFLTQFYSA